MKHIYNNKYINYYYMENLYSKLLEKQDLINKQRYEKQKQYSREYYWRNREYILERNRILKYERSEYFKQWYEKIKRIKRIKILNNKINQKLIIIKFINQKILFYLK